MVAQPRLGLARRVATLCRAGAGIGMELSLLEQLVRPILRLWLRLPELCLWLRLSLGYGLAAAAAGPLAVAAGTTAPLVTGRSVATGQLGNFCTTSVKTCELRHASYLGGGCSCRGPGGPARGGGERYLGCGGE